MNFLGGLGISFRVGGGSRKGSIVSASIMCLLQCRMRMIEVSEEAELDGRIDSAACFAWHFMGCSINIWSQTRGNNNSRPIATSSFDFETSGRKRFSRSSVWLESRENINKLWIESSRNSNDINTSNRDSTATNLKIRVRGRERERERLTSQIARLRMRSLAEISKGLKILSFKTHDWWIMRVYYYGYRKY